MPKLTPDRLPTELTAVLQEIRPPRRIKHLQKTPPVNLHDSLMQAALVCPRHTDIAAFYFVSEEIFAKWRKADPRIDVVIAQARQADTQEVLQAVRKRAIEGSAPHAKIYLERMRPDLNDISNTQINNTVKVTVLPTPPALTKPDTKIRTPQTYEGTATHLRTSKPKTPLFGGRDVGIPNAPEAEGKT